jgi:adenosine deaminase
MQIDQAGKGGLVGFDLAGDEASRSPSQVRQAFLPVMERCLHLTIHAGETLPAQSVWEAVYHLSAERIGHGLSLIDDPLLMNRFKNSGIGIEMCPSSNAQIIGFKDNHLPSTNRLNPYPLKTYLDQGLRVTVNTDNPGISRTDFSNELHRAARLTPGGLSLWQILQLVRNGFKAAFVTRDRRQELILNAERQIMDIVRKELPA